MSGRGRGGFRGGRGGGFGRGGGGRQQGTEVTTKLFVGNVPTTATREELCALFEKFGNVVEADIVNNYAFVHYGTETEAVSAKENLHGYLFQGNEIRVELSRSKVRHKPGMGSGEKCFRCGKEGHWSTECTSGGGGMGGRKGPPTTKLFVGNLPESATNGELEELFSKHGKVVEADVLKNYGFVHFSQPEEAEAAVEALHQSIFKGEVIKVEMSRSRLHQKPGESGRSSGFMSKDCPRYGGAGRGGGRGGRGGDRRPAFDRDYSPDPYYRDRYRDRYSPYPDVYSRRRLPPPPSVPSPRSAPYSRDPYERPPPDYYRRSPERDPIDEYAKRRADEAYFEFYNYYAGRRRDLSPPPPQMPPKPSFEESRLPMPRERPVPPQDGMGMSGGMGSRPMPPQGTRPMPPGPRPIPQGSRPMQSQPTNNYTDFSGLLNNLLHQSL